MPVTLRTAAASALLLAACTSFDLDKGRSYPCQADGSTDQCAPGWVCGLEGVCHDGDAGGPFQCSGAAPCTGGWVCGLENVCHAPDAGAPYQCATILGPAVTNANDSWCTTGWFCSKLGHCVQPGATEGTIATFPPDASVSFAPVSPVAAWTAPSAVAFSMQAPVSGGPPEVLQQNAAWVDAQGLALLRRTELFDPITQGSADAFTFSRLPFSQTPLAMAATAQQIYVQTPAGLWSVLPDGGGVAVRTDVAAAALRQSPTVLQPMLLAFDGGTYWVVGEDAGGGFSVSPPAMLPGAGTIIQMTSALGSAGCPTNWIALDARGALFSASWNGAQLSTWTPLSLPGVGDAGLFPIDVQAGGKAAVTSALVDDGGQPYVGIWTLSGICGGPTLSQVLAPCPVCNGGLGEIHPFITPGGTYAVEARCSDGSGPVRLAPDPFDGHCLSVPWPLAIDTQTDDLLPADALDGAAGYAGAHGQLEFGPSLISATPFTLDTVPTALIGHDVQLIASSGGERFVWTPQLGAIRTRTELAPSEQLVGSVDGNPWMGLFADGSVKWVLDSDDDVNDNDFDNLLPWSMAAADLGVIRFQPPFQAAVRDDGAGSYVAVVAANDTLLGVDTRDTFVPFEAASLQVKAVPAPGSPISSLALLPGTQDNSGRRFISGYVLAEGQVYSFSGSTDAPVWTAKAIDTGTPLPDVGGAQNQVSVPIKVFAADNRAMLGLQDGAVYSLPNLLPVAPSFIGQGLSIPDGSGTPFTGVALDYGQACGVTYVNTVLGIYRLQAPPPGQRVGFWVLEPSFKGALSPRDPTFQAQAGLYPARFYGALDELYLTSGYGSIARLRVGGCPL